MHTTFFIQLIYMYSSTSSNYLAYMHVVYVYMYTWNWHVHTCAHIHL